jgi:hypothetical protein
MDDKNLARTNVARLLDIGAGSAQALSDLMEEFKQVVQQSHARRLVQASSMPHPTSRGASQG